MNLSLPRAFEALPLGMQQSLEAELAQGGMISGCRGSAPGDQGLQRVTSELRGPRNEVEVDEGVEKLWAEVSHEGPEAHGFMVSCCTAPCLGFLWQWGNGRKEHVWVPYDLYGGMSRGVKNEVQRAIGLWISRLLQQKFQRLLGQVSEARWVLLCTKTP